MSPAEKINVDGAVARDGSRGSISAVARSLSRVYLGSSGVMFESVSGPEILETVACREGVCPWQRIYNSPRLNLRLIVRVW